MLDKIFNKNQADVSEGDMVLNLSDDKYSIPLDEGDEVLAVTQDGKVVVRKNDGRVVIYNI